MNILVVGGAGYIGSHMVQYLESKKCKVTVLDNLSTGYRDAVNSSQLNVGDLADISFLNKLFRKQTFDAVMHFASNILVDESISNPAKYYRNNVTNTQNLLDVMLKHSVKSFIFSSTAAIFGEPEYIPIDEQHPKQPISPYGRSKWMVEQILEDYDHAYGLKSICLRYFNASGADPEGKLGERHEPETHLIPLVLQAASGKRKSITVFGRSYDTEDGTCIRDYIHVNDLCEAHWLALRHLQTHGESHQFNLGNGNGFSVQQIIDICLKVTGRNIHIIEGEVRKGDPAVLVANSSLAKSKLNWLPQHSDLKSIIYHAWRWEVSRL